MNQSASFYRKIVYLAAIGVLMFPLARLGSPSTLRDEGGKLAQLREEHSLGQAQLGEIDPASEAMRLATLGLRGIATTLLWTKANNYKKTEDWTAFRATLDQLARLQPYFISVWRYQAWNLSYNVSVELDDVNDRFYYVLTGIEYLTEGTKYNRDNPTLLSDVGWFLGNKIGRADEHDLYRKLFKEDDEFFAKYAPNATPRERDNWLQSKDWYEKAVAAVDEKKQNMGTKNPTIFYQWPAKSQINYAEAIEDDGVLGFTAQREWAGAEEMWLDYGNRDLMSTGGFLIRLENYDFYDAKVEELEQELDALSPGLRQQLEQEAEASLTDEQRKAWEGRNNPENDPAASAEVAAILQITNSELAAAIGKQDPSKAVKARRITNELDDAYAHRTSIKINRDVSNYEYWKTRTQFEQLPEVLDARELSAEAKRLVSEGDPWTAKEKYEASFPLWAAALKKFPDLPDDSATGTDIMVFIEEYADVLDVLSQSLADEEIVDSFPLWNIVEANDSSIRFNAELAAYRERQRAADDESSIDPADLLGQ